jgi:hypothetical protein
MKNNHEKERQGCIGMKTSKVLMTLVLLAVVARAQPAKVNIAVQELTGKGLEQSAASIISDRLRAECINTGVFRVMERTEMENILKEQGFQQTGACDEASCLVEVGQILGVERMVAGSIGKVGNFYTISLRMINVATGEILYTVNVDHKGSIEDVISKATGDAAVKLAHSAGGDIARAFVSGKKGDLYITADMKGASIEIDGRKVEGVTPLTLQGYPAGEHRIIARRYNHYGSMTVQLAPDDLLKVHVPMSEGEGALKVFTKPPGATVYVDGANKGKSPLKIDNVAAGEHVVSVRHRGYLSQKTSVSVNIDETSNLSTELEPAAYITVKTDVASAAILLNGHKAGAGSVESYEVPAGEVTVQVEATGYDPYTTSAKIPMGQTKSLDVTLVSSFAMLDITTDPPGAQVWLNGKAAGQTPYTNNRLVPGKYSVTLQLDGHDPHETTVDLEKAKTREIRAQLVSKYGKLEVESRPTGAHVFLNGQHAGQTPYSNYELEPGAYGLQLKLETYTDIVETVQLSKGQTLGKEFTLEHTKQYLDSVASALAAVKKKKQWARRIVFGVLAAGSGGLGTYFNTQAASAAEDQQAIQAEYRAASGSFDAYQADYDAKADEAKQARTGRNAFVAFAGAFGCAFVISIPF